MASRAILSNFFEEQLTENHLQLKLSGLSRARFPTTFLEIAVNSVTDGKLIRELYWTKYDAALSSVVTEKLIVACLLVGMGHYWWLQCLNL